MRNWGRPPAHRNSPAPDPDPDAQKDQGTGRRTSVHPTERP
ncbi:hypothetical protein FHR32_005448 [Streptosporangium album]|uniref:Uncharacterized protein n=1 Tax=Streptosporangium album TaxID=47479 RepID=A0A7W7WBJ9_9ACTN|nr:hypothetical protein [Streptosporangium album]